MTTRLHYVNVDRFNSYMSRTYGPFKTYKEAVEKAKQEYVHLTGGIREITIKTTLMETFYKKENKEHE